MRVLILGEGATDLGQIGPDGTLQREGCLPVLVRKLLGERQVTGSIEIRARELRKVRTFRLGPKRIGKSEHGFANKLQVALSLKEGRDVDAIVAVVDRDGAKNSDRIVELNKGRDALHAAGKACAVGVAIELIEAWLLADEQAISSVLGYSVPRQPDPESLSSRDEQSDQSPRGRLKRLIANSQQHTRDNYAETCASIVGAAQVSVIETRCNGGFEPFAQQVREMAGS